MAEFSMTPLVYFLETPTQEIFFDEISRKLVARNVMQTEGKAALIAREQTFP
ncbi:PTS galactitol transporter subunit IIA, partial [Lacticaseibacillus rhamnosus]